MSCFVDNRLSVHGITHQFGIVGKQAKIGINVPFSARFCNRLSERLKNAQRMKLNNLVYVGDDQSVFDVPIEECC